MFRIEYAYRMLFTVLVMVGLTMFYRMRHPSTTLAADGMDAAWDSAALQTDGSRQPTIVLFTADWCPSCRRLHEDTLSRGEVQETLRNHFRFVRVDLTNPTPAAEAHAQKMGVSGIPAMILFDADGREIDRAHYLPPARMMKWLEQAE